GAAIDTEGGVDNVEFVAFAGNGVRGATLRAGGTPDTRFDDGIRQSENPHRGSDLCDQHTTLEWSVPGAACSGSGRQASLSPSRKAAVASLNAAGWSMFAAWPASGMTALAAPGIFFTM